MTLNVDIDRELQDKAISLGYPVTTRGLSFTPPRDNRGLPGVYLRYTNLRAQPEDFSLGFAGSEIHSGVFQLDILVPQGMEQGAAQAIVDVVCTAFQRGTRLGSVKIERPPYPGPELQETPYRNIPVNIRWVVYHEGARP